MKVPKKGLPPPTPPLKGGRPKGLTKRTVKGAAGGMLGVDYEDSRRPDPFLTRGDSTVTDDGPEQKQTLRAEGDGDGGINMGYRSTDASKDHRPDRSAFSDFGKDQDAGDLTARTKQRRKIKKTRHSKESDEEQQSNQEESSETFEDRFEEFDSAEANQASDRPRSKFFDEEELAQPGDLSLVNPDTIQRRLGSPMAYAKHVMILAEAFRKSTGATRSEAVSYMASMFLSLTDTRFGWSALKEFGHGTGIIDIYPLEVIEEIMTKFPGHLPKVSFGRIFSRSSKQEDVLRTNTDTPLLLSYPEDLKIRSFALKGGGIPGYTFEPADEPGQYKLQIRAPGRFNLLIGSVNRSGFSLIEPLTVVISASATYQPREELDLGYPARDQAKVAEWPKPELTEPNPIIRSEEITPNTEQNLRVMSAADLIHFTTMSALTGPKGELNEISEETAPELQDTSAALKATTSTSKDSFSSREEDELTTADQDALKEVVADVFGAAQVEITPPSTQKVDRKEVSEQTEDSRQPLERMRDEGEPAPKEWITEEHEEPSGEATEPIKREDLAWIFEDSE